MLVKSHTPLIGILYQQKRNGEEDAQFTLMVPKFSAYWHFFFKNRRFEEEMERESNKELQGLLLIGESARRLGKSMEKAANIVSRP
ncbi:hypothetical protein L2E82_24815 [Cichorium intybus]|uniref:Uncharacterized protein n=2 Tax=Cichorium intybus TaxID=13427 RepID=A0ACB9E1S9_CICIN|nr:hypothetical protein L2E82_24814 [Cichorium intybus]KAI3752778.1 hypothetical protein L2E82_24815 [Cichorium intybus]